MPNFLISPSVVAGTVAIPPSKSQTLRAILFGLLAEGTSHIYNPLLSPDALAMQRAVTLLGGQIESFESHIEVTGTGGRIEKASDVIDCGNSGLVLRLVGALAGLGSYPIVLTGDASIRHLRPATALLNGLRQLGVDAISTNGNGYAPLIIRGPMRGGLTTLDGGDSQPVSGLLIACSLAKRSTEILVTSPGERPWIDLTLSWIEKLGGLVERQGYHHYKVAGKTAYKAFEYHVPGDFSSAAFPLAAGLITGGEIVAKHLVMKDLQGDKKILDIFSEMGADVRVEAEENTVRVKPSGTLRGVTLDVNDIIDAVPLLTVLACFASTPSKLFGAKIARHKESDRLACIAKELTKMGAKIGESEDSLTIQPARLTGATVYSHSDHRLAMALAVGALGAGGTTTVEDVDCIKKSYPGFLQHLQSLGALIQ